MFLGVCIYAFNLRSYLTHIGVPTVPHINVLNTTYISFFEVF